MKVRSSNEAVLLFAIGVGMSAGMSAGLAEHAARGDLEAAHRVGGRCCVLLPPAGSGETIDNRSGKFTVATPGQCLLR